MIKNERGFSLFEMAIVLVIFGLVLASASSVLTLFVNRGGSEKTRQMMEANKNALYSYVQANYQLPTTAVDNTAPFIDFQHNVTYPTDGYNIAFTYYADPILDKTMTGWNLASITGSVVNTVCGANATNTQVQICTNAACTTSNTVSNVAFVMISGGENKNIQTASATAAGVRTYTVRTQDTAAVAYVNDANTTAQYDDIVDWISLNELRAKVGCDGESMKFITQIMPPAKKNAAYSFNLYIEGGIPIATNYSGTYVPEYEWNVYNSTGTDNTIVDGFYNYNVVKNSGSTSIDTLSNTTFTQGSYLQISGNASTFAKGQYIIKVNVRDKAGQVITRSFILNAEYP